MVSGRTIAIIPARGGSKRIPRKNLTDFFGKPMIAWTIEAALESGRFDLVFVSTEDREIAETARRFGAAVPFLRESHFDDFSDARPAIVAALERLEREGRAFDIVAQLLPNCPLRGVAEIDAALANFEKSGAPFQISCFPFGWMNPWWAAKVDTRGCPQPMFPEAMTRRSQDLETLYCPTGAIWLARMNAFRAEQTFYGKEHIYFPMDWKAAVDIDTRDDLDMAKALFAMAGGPRETAHG